MAARGPRALTPMQRAFVAAYVGEARGQGATAARMAGYKGNNHVLAVTAQGLLKNPSIKQALEVFRMATATAAIMTAEQCAERLSRIGRGDETLTEKRVVNGGPAGFVDVETPPGFAHQIEAIKALVKMRGYDKPATPEDQEAPTVSPDMERALIRLAQLTPEQWAAFQAGVTS